MTLTDTAADTDYEPRYETKHQRVEAWKGLMSSNRMDDGVCRTSLCDFILLSSFVQVFFVLETEMCRRDYFFEFNRIRHSKRLSSLFSRVTLYIDMNRVRRVFLAR